MPFWKNKTPDISKRPVKVRMSVKQSITHSGLWEVRPEILAFPMPVAPQKNHVIFILDTSDSMRGVKLDLVKQATNNLLDQLTVGDRFSIISFCHDAKTVVARNNANMQTIHDAKLLVNAMQASGGTSFVSAFAKIPESNLIPPSANTTIIFLTDGEDTSCWQTESLLRFVRHNKQCARVIPLGIGLKTGSTEYNFLCTLAHAANGDAIKPIFIYQNTPEAYRHAFQQAFDLACQHSEKSVQVELTIEAKHPINATHTRYRRELRQLAYDGKNPCGHTFYFESPIPPTSCKLRFTCDDISLSDAHVFKPGRTNRMVDFNLMKLKDNSTSSWVKCFAILGLSLLLFAAGAAVFMFAPLSMPLLLGISIGAGVLGIGALGLGIANLFRKTLILPDKVTRPVFKATTTNLAVHMPGRAKPAPKVVQAAQARRPTGKPSNAGRFAPRRSTASRFAADTLTALQRVLYL